jgi:hypothetical protein
MEFWDCDSFQPVTAVSFISSYDFRRFSKEECTLFLAKGVFSAGHDALIQKEKRAENGTLIES